MTLWIRLLGDWNFLHAWWWQPIIAPILGLAWLVLIAAAGVALYFLITGTTRLSEYREAIFPDRERERVPEDLAALAAWLEARFPDLPEEQIAAMEALLEDVLREDIHPDMSRRIEAQGVSVRLIAAPPAEVVRDVGTMPLAVWIPALNAIELYAAPLLEEAEQLGKPLRTLLGEVLLHETGHALGLGEEEVSDFGV